MTIITPTAAVRIPDPDRGTAMVPRRDNLESSANAAMGNLPARSLDLLIRPMAGGSYVVKPPHSKDFLQLGEEEHFLLMLLDGATNVDTVCSRYADRFGQVLSPEELSEFLELARQEQLLVVPTSAGHASLTAANERTRCDNHSNSKTYSFWYWRKVLFDPDALFAWLVPKIRFVWTRSFLAGSGVVIAIAAILIWTCRHELAHSVSDLFRWQSLGIVCMVFLVVSILHEFAHGLTCKYFGGEVHETGFLMMFLIPCLYCDVSSAWMFTGKSSRICVMIAGIYLELILWALAAMVWWVTMPNSFVNDLALIVLGLCGLQTLMNLIPFIKLDGYFLLSDWVEIPNLRRRALDYLGTYVRWLLVGTERPLAEPHGGLLLIFGFLCGACSCVAVIVACLGLIRIAGPNLAPAIAMILVTVFLLWMGSQWPRSARSEASTMKFQKSKRLAIWSLLILAFGLALKYVQVEDWAGGPCEIRPRDRFEIRAPESSFLTEILVQEGERISCGQPIARLEVPNLESRTRQKLLEAAEVAARLQLLVAGTRPEQLATQRQRVARAREWRDLAALDLCTNQLALAAELDRLDSQCKQYEAESKTAAESLRRLEVLAHRKVASTMELDEARRKASVAQAQWDQARSQFLLRESLGTRETFSGLDANSELVRRDIELADLEAELALMVAGIRSEEIEAERAHLARVREDANSLKQIAGRLLVRSPISGIVATQRLRDKSGQYLEQGDLICVVEDPYRLELEIHLKEQDVAATRLGQVVELRARASPHEVIRTQVNRFAPIAVSGEGQSTVTLYCDLGDSVETLRSGMTGFSRVSIGRKSLGEIAIDRTVRFLRTQYWFFRW